VPEAEETPVDAPGRNAGTSGCPSFARITTGARVDGSAHAQSLLSSKQTEQVMNEIVRLLSAR